MLVQDVVVVVPGIMGSVLEVEGSPIWGFDPRLLTALWTSGPRTLAVTPAEREILLAGGRPTRVRATRLLDVPGHAPVLQGIAPYGRLVERLRTMVPGEALLEFPYDWRLPVAYNARLLGEAALARLRHCRRPSSPSRAAGESRSDGRDPRLVFVAHSMGGLLVRSMFTLPDIGELLRESTRACLTLGTPFRGAAKAALMLGGSGTAPGRRRLRELARTMPGVHDLLPTYPCLPDGTRLSLSDVASFGGNSELARDSTAFHAALVGVQLPGHVALRGAFQSTPTTLTLDAGQLKADGAAFVLNSDGSCRTDATGQLIRDTDQRGDGTVPRFSAALIDGPVVAQQHGGLARVGMVLDQTEDLLRQMPTFTDTLGPDDLGLEVPDMVFADQPWDVTVLGARRPLRLRVTDARTGAPRTTISLTPSDRGHTGRVPAGSLAPGLYEVAIPTGADGVTQTVLVTKPEA